MGGSEGEVWLDVDLLRQVGGDLAEEYAKKRRLLSFAEYFALLARDPRRHVRGAAQYVRDAFLHYGTYQIPSPGGGIRRFRLFDCPFDGGREPLVGQEDVQNRVFSILDRFARQGRVDRLILLHGPNGSSKSTFVDVLARALKHYSTLDEGALYRFNWVFPAGSLKRKGIGFLKEMVQDGAQEESYAHLPDEMVEARLPDELRDHPLLLIPAGRRRRLVAELLDRAGVPEEERFLPHYILYGDLSHRNRVIFETLLAAYEGDVRKVLRHVQVERFFLSRRYRVGLVSVEPKLAVDAATRQLTMDRSLANLPPVLQNLELFRYTGDLVAANRGLIEFSDLLKRPVEAFKYLLSMVETGKVALEGALLYVDAVLFASTNELQLAAFRESPEFPSFRGRFEFVSVPYLLDYPAEQRIYENKVPAETLGKSVAPHTFEMSALWAVLTRLYPPDPAEYPEPIREAVERMTPLEKAKFYAHGILPEWVSGERLKLLRQVWSEMRQEYAEWPNYEGNSGVSPRTMVSVLSEAARTNGRDFVSTLDVISVLTDLCRQKNLYEFLRRPVQRNGYWDATAAVEAVRSEYLQLLEREAWKAVGLVDEARVEELLARYVDHVSAWSKGEKVKNPVTGESEPPDEALMDEVETRLGIENRTGFRDDVMTRIAAWALSHPGEPPDLSGIFVREHRTLLDRFYEERRQVLVERLDAVAELCEGRMDAGDPRYAKTREIWNAFSALGYTEPSLLEAVSLVREQIRHQPESSET